jgi:hypothetical protein
MILPNLPKRIITGAVIMDWAMQPDFSLLASAGGHPVQIRPFSHEIPEVK